MIGFWSARLRTTETILFDATVPETGANLSLGGFGLLAAVTTDEARTIRRALLVFRLFVAFLEFCVQFTLILGLAFLFIRVFHAPFWALAATVYTSTALLAFGLLFPALIKQIDAAQQRRGGPALTGREKRRMLGQFAKGYLVNLIITTIVLFLSAAIVGASPTIGPVDVGTAIRNNSIAMAGATTSAFILTIVNQSFGLKPEA